MKQLDSIEYSLSNLGDIVSFKNFFKNIQRDFENEHKELMFGKKGKDEVKQYFNFVKFLFSSPNKAV